MNSGKTVATRPAQVSAPPPSEELKAGSESSNPVGVEQQTLSGERLCNLLPTSRTAPRCCARNPPCRMSRFVLWPRPSSPRLRTKAAPSATATSRPRPCCRSCGEGFEPFMVCQTRVRRDDRRDFTKHMIRLRHASQIDARGEANEIILLNSHDGTSSYQMLAGMFRFVCQNGLVCGDTVADARVPHKGDVAAQVIEGAYQVLHGFEQAQVSREAMRAVTLDGGEAEVFARAALALKYDDHAKPAPITERQVLAPRRLDDNRADLWSVFNRTQENLIRGGLVGRSNSGRRQRTRPVQGIDQDLRLNRALWLLADGLRQLKA